MLTLPVFDPAPSVTRNCTNPFGLEAFTGAWSGAVAGSVYWKNTNVATAATMAVTNRSTIMPLVSIVFTSFPVYYPTNDALRVVYIKRFLLKGKYTQALA